jgi:hypothetical protein
MKLRELFLKPVDRHIEGVIKADDLTSLKLEVEEYVLTNEIARRISEFFSTYNDYHGVNGAWISGFFGSGKSHLLKMLALLLENQPIDGKPAIEYFLPKCGEDAMLKGEMRKAVSIPSKSILFNIDQKADTINKSEVDAVLSVFLKVFNEMCGYYGKHGYIAQFERQLDQRGQLDDFKYAYKQVSGSDWESGREQVILEQNNIAEAYARVSGSPFEQNLKIMEHYRADFKVSIADFANMVNDYIQKQAPEFRLNFFVDEVGQYVADNIKLMTNLQTIAESLATICRGQSFIVVTAQEDMESVLGEMKQREEVDFSKIQARFRTRLKLTSANVDEVIQKRLLKKNPIGENCLIPIYKEQVNNFGTLFEFSDGSITYRNFLGQDHFVRSYPFIPYQFSLFQSSIETLSQHNAFEGRHSSVGERSMLGVFQEVAKQIAEKDIGELATFDLMFEGIRTTLKTQIQSSITTAENNLDDAFAIQMLKALFLVKYVKEFKATPRNMRVLMHSHFDLDFSKLKRKVDEALTLLEQQTYIQRNGELYEYLTDEEKDVEQEIKNTEVSSGETASILEDILFNAVIKDRKMRYDATGQDMPFSKKLDDRLIGREQELAIHFVTPFHEHHEDVAILQANSLGRAELLIVLPPNERLVRDVLMYKKTEKYIRVHLSTAQQDNIRRIMSDKGFQNRERMNEIQARLGELVSKARIFVSGEEIDTNSLEARTRIYQGFSELIVKTYPNLRMLREVAYKEEDIHKYLSHTRHTMFGADGAEMNEAENEMLAFIRSNHHNGMRTTLRGLENKFSTRPYGWYLAAIQCVLAMLCGRGKVEVRSDANLLEETELERALKNTQGYANIILEPQIEFTAAQTRRLKDFFSEFFDKPPSASEARELGKETSVAFRDLLNELENLAAQARRYPFLTALEEPIQKIEQLAGKPYTYYLTELSGQEEHLLEMKEERLDPIRRFMSGANRTIYDDASEFYNRQEPNFSAFDDDRPNRLKAILAHPGCYTGNQMREAKEIVSHLKEDIQAMVEGERQIAIGKMSELQDRLHQMEEYVDIDEAQQSQVDEAFTKVIRELEQQTLIAVIRDVARTFQNQTYPGLLTDISNFDKGDKGNGQTGVAEGRVEYIAANRLHFSFNKAFLADEADIEAYLEKLRVAMLAAIREGKRIQI